MAISQSLFRVNWNQNGANILDRSVLKTIKDMKSSFAVFPYMNIETINIYSKSNSALIIVFTNASSSPICDRGALAESQEPVSDTFDSMSQSPHIYET